MQNIKIYEIPTIDYIEKIDDPRVGMIFYIADIDMYYSVKALKEINSYNTKGDKVVEYIISDYEEFGSGSGGGSGLTAQQLANIAKIPVIQNTVDGLPNNYAAKAHRHDASEIDNLPSGGNGASTTIVDNLNSTSTTSALSANQGRVIKSSLDNKANEYNIVNMGGVGNGIYDNYPILLPLLKIKNATIYIPKGKYKINNVITFNDINIIGEEGSELIGKFKVGVNVKISNIKFTNEQHFYSENFSSNNTFTNCIFDNINVNDSKSIYINDCLARFWKFENCKFINNITVQLISKSKEDMYIHDFVFKNCYFENDYGGTFYCGSQDHTPGSEYVNGYYNIVLDSCDFIASSTPSNEYAINVSFDCGVKDINELPLSKDVIITNCYFKNGFYVFENAGCRKMTIDKCIFEIDGITDTFISFSRLDNVLSEIKFTNNTLNNNTMTYKNCNINGSGNIVSNNSFKNTLVTLFSGNSNTFNNNKIDCLLNSSETKYPISLSSIALTRVYNNFISCDANNTDSNFNVFFII